MYFFKQLILGILLLETICISVQGSITGYIDSADKQKFLQILSRTLEPPVDDTVSLYYGAKGLQVLKKEINKAKIPEVCKTLKTKFNPSDSLENVFFSLSTWNMLGCQGKLHEENLVKEIQSILGNENSLVADIRYALEIHSLLKYQVPQPQNVAKTIVNCLRKDDSLPELGHALHAAALLGGEKGNGKFGVERAEEAVARADELDGRLLQWEGGLSVTSLILTGLLRLYPTGTQLPLTTVQADKVASYLLTRRTVPTAKGVLALLEAAHALADSQLSPVSITIVGPAVVRADRPELRVYVGDLLGRPLRAAAPVVAQSATRLADDVVVLAKQPLSPGTAQGEFTLPLKLEPSLYKIALNTANGASASFDVRVLGPMEVHWLEIGLSDTDGGGIPSQPSRLRFPSGKLQDRLQADAGQRLVVRISLSRPVHQVFLRLAHREDGREIIFVAEPETGGAGASSGQDAKIYKVEVSPGEELATSGLYDMEAILGDSVITNPVKWNIGQVDVNLGRASSSSESEDSSNDSTSSSSSSDSGDRDRGATTQTTVGEDISPQQPGQEIVIPIEILGTNPLASAAVGPEIHAEIASRWTTFCRTGLDKDDRKSLMEKYPSPSNVEGLSPPMLNAEISVCLTENLLKQDKFLSTLQRQIAAAMSAIALPMNVFFSNPSDETNAHLQHLANGSKLLADVMHSLSRHRRYGLSNTMNNNIRKVVMDRPIEGFLFGDDLPNQIKTAQELKKVSAEIKIQSFPSTSGLGSRLPNKPSSGSRQTSDFLAKRFKFSHRKKAEGSKRNQKLKRSWKRSEYRN